MSEIPRRFAAGFVIGLAAAAYGGELYVHRQAHRTLLLQRGAREPAALAVWAAGSDPVTFDIGHRVHHAEETSIPPLKFHRAVTHLLRDSFVSRKKADKALRDVRFKDAFDLKGMNPDNDPLITWGSDGSAELKYEGVNRMLRKLPEPVANLAVPAAIIGLDYFAKRWRRSSHPLAESVAGYAGYFTAVASADFLPSFSERRRGAATGSELGVNFPKPFTLMYPGANVRHLSHHQNPGIGMTPDVPWYAIDRFMTWGLKKLHLATDDPALL